MYIYIYIYYILYIHLLVHLFLFFYQQPTNGVAFVKGQSLAYVPRKGFLGNDSFLYKTYDAYIDPSFPNYVHTAIGFVTIFVVKHPPEIISRPKPLEVCQEQSLNIGRYNVLYLRLVIFMNFLDKAKFWFCYVEEEFFN